VKTGTREGWPSVPLPALLRDEVWKPLEAIMLEVLAGIRAV
jgi:hypothetical protein